MHSGRLEGPRIELVDHRPRLQRRAGLHVLQPSHQAADLVLPAAAGGQHLLHLEDLQEELVAEGCPPIEPLQRREDRARQDGGSPEARALGNRAEQGQLEAPTGRLEDGRQRGPVGLPGAEAEQHEGRPGQGERTARVAVGPEARRVPDHFRAPEVDRMNRELRLGRSPHEDLDRALAVEVHRHVHHGAAVAVGVRRGIGPSAGQVEAHRRARPDDLVQLDRAPQADPRPPAGRTGLRSGPRQARRQPSRPEAPRRGTPSGAARRSARSAAPGARCPARPPPAPRGPARERQRTRPLASPRTISVRRTADLSSSRVSCVRARICTRRSRPALPSETRPPRRPGLGGPASSLPDARHLRQPRKSSREYRSAQVPWEPRPKSTVHARRAMPAAAVRRRPPCPATGCALNVSSL